MIKVNFNYDSEHGCLKLCILGHADCAPKGEDLVCAAVSALAITADETAKLLWEYGFLKRPPLVVLQDGNALVIVNPEEKYLTATAMAFWAIQTGFFALEDRYPQHVEMAGVLNI